MIATPCVMADGEGEKKGTKKRLKPPFYQTTRKTTNCCDGYLFSVFLRDMMWPVGWTSRRVTAISPFCYNKVTGLVCVWNIKYSLRWLGVSNHFLTFFFSFIFLSLFSFEIYPFLLYFYFRFTHFSAVFLFFSASLCFFFSFFLNFLSVLRLSRQHIDRLGLLYVSYVFWHYSPTEFYWDRRKKAKKKITPSLLKRQTISFICTVHIDDGKRRKVFPTAVHLNFPAIT